MDLPVHLRLLRPLREMLLGDSLIGREAVERLELEDTRSGLGRLMAIGPLLFVLHLVHVIVMTTAAPEGGPATVQWRTLIGASHAVMMVFATGMMLLAWMVRRRLDTTDLRPSVLVVALSVGGYVVAAGWFAGVDQLVTTNITPYLVAVMATGVMLPLPALPLTIAHVLGLATFVGSVSHFGGGGAGEMSNQLNGLTVALAGWMVARALRTARGRNVASAMTIEAQKAELATMNAELTRLADLDAMTALPNRRSLIVQAERMRAHAERHDESMSLLMLDVDHFKEVNDADGHARGDEVLLAVVEACREELRGEDLFARMGGEEFAVLLPQASDAQARVVAERLRARVEGLGLAHPNGRVVTISLGVCAVDPKAERAIDEALARADAELYAAKRAGRNRVGASA